MMRLVPLSLVLLLASPAFADYEEKVNVETAIEAYTALKKLPPLVVELNAIAFASGRSARLVAFKGKILTHLGGGFGGFEKFCSVAGQLTVGLGPLTSVSTSDPALAGKDKITVDVKGKLANEAGGACPSLAPDHE
jgi:hypothetical protein